MMLMFNADQSQCLSAVSYGVNCLSLHDRAVEETKETGLDEQSETYGRPVCRLVRVVAKDES